MEEFNQKEVRKSISKLTWFYLAGTLLSMISQIIVVNLVLYFKREWLQNGDISLIVTMGTLYIIAYPIFIFLVTRIPKTVTLEKHKMSIGQIIVAFIITYAITYFFNIIGSIITTAIGILKGDAVTNVLQETAMATSVIPQIIIIAIIGPIFEELIFRKLLVDRLVKYGEGVTIFLSGFLFALFHGNFSQAIYAFALGAFFTFIYIRTGNIKYTMILHILINFFGTVVTSLITKANNEMLLGMYVFAIICVLLIGIVIIIVSIVKKKFYLLPVALPIPNGKKFSTVMINSGVIVYTVIYGIIIIIQLFT